MRKSFVKDSGANKDWELKITPYYSYVEDYIDVKRCTIRYHSR